MDCLISFLLSPHEAGIFIIPITQMRKPRYREVKELTKGYIQLVSAGAGLGIQPS